MTYSGARRPKILFLGESWGSSEAELRKPFVGATGKEFFRLLGEAWPTISPELHQKIARQLNYGLIWVEDRELWFEKAEIAFTDVFNWQPPGNKLVNVCKTKTEMKNERGKDYAESYPYPPLAKGKYIPLELCEGELERLKREVQEANPTLLVALGGAATWATLLASNIGAIRGYTAEATWAGPRVKVLPTFHPANIFYDYSTRPIILADMMKAEREAKFAEIRRPKRRILVSPSIEEVEGFTSKLLHDAEAHLKTFKSPLEVGADTETVIGQIEMISFAPSLGEAIVIPFIDKKKPGRSYWDSVTYEWRAWVAVRKICQSPAIRIVGQNFIYDIQYLCPAKIRLSNCPEDTMLLHHSLYPEMNKGLGFLGSIYTNESSWKLLPRQKPDTEKRDE